MITITPGYQTGERWFKTIEEAQQSELAALFKITEGFKLNLNDDDPEKIAEVIVANTDEVVAILTCTPKSKSPRKPRSDIGKKRTRKT